MCERLGQFENTLNSKNNQLALAIIGECFRIRTGTYTLVIDQQCCIEDDEDNYGRAYGDRNQDRSN